MTRNREQRYLDMWLPFEVVDLVCRLGVAGAARHITSDVAETMGVELNHDRIQAAVRDLGIRHGIKDEMTNEIR
ncbi:MAG: hypothetical protein AMJ46_12710 [Latescibacteria bacterium DG_63]|nr:MAG: hypothetical protein AMJ46_12710 [Latescibacteria bacterium DG_63]